MQISYLPTKNIILFLFKKKKLYFGRKIRSQRVFYDLKVIVQWWYWQAKWWALYIYLKSWNIIKTTYVEVEWYVKFHANTSQTFDSFFTWYNYLTYSNVTSYFNWSYLRKNHLTQQQRKKGIRDLQSRLM